MRELFYGLMPGRRYVDIVAEVFETQEKDIPDWVLIIYDQDANISSFAFVHWWNNSGYWLINQIKVSTRELRLS